MPRGRNLFLSLRDKLITSFDQREGACVWTTAALGRVSSETCDLELHKAETRRKDKNDVDLVEEMRTCEGCNIMIARSAALRCGVCRIAYYCSHKCHKTHWSLHKKTCRKIMKDERHVREAQKKRDSKPDNEPAVPHAGRVAAVDDIRRPRRSRRIPRRAQGALTGRDG